MMNNIEFIDAGNARYLSEFMTDLPDNAMFNKVAVGCGATSIALTSKCKMVLCVPFVSLIINKLEWCKQNEKDAIGIYSNKEDPYANSIDALKDFTGNVIIVTYDSLQKVVAIIDPAEWKITIDEAHKLIDSGAFRGGAIRSVLANFKKFKSYCFVTATPVPDEYQLPELKDIQKHEVVWNNLSPVNVNYMPLENKLHETIAVIALSHLLGNSIGNAHVFINSVKGIITTINHLKKSGENIKDNIRIVCADNANNDDLIQSKLGSNFGRTENTTVARRINFYTSTSFEGSDLKDTEGVSYVVTDGSIDHTKINILTTLPQIASRIRDSKYKNEITLLFTPNEFYSHTTEAEFSRSVKCELARYSLSVADFKTAAESTKKLLLEGAKNCPYLIDCDGELLLNEAAWYNKMFDFRTIHNTYYVVKDEHTSFKPTHFKHNAVEYNYIPRQQPAISGLNKLRLGKVPNFKDLCLEYIQLKSIRFGIGADQIEAGYPIIKEAYEQLGADKMKALRYRQGEIERELIKVNALRSNDWKVVKLLDYRVGQWLSSPQIRADLEKVYMDLEINKIPIGTDLNKFYILASHSKTINGKRVAGFKIINTKIKYTFKSI